MVLKLWQNLTLLFSWIYWCFLSIQFKGNSCMHTLHLKRVYTWVYMFYVCRNISEQNLHLIDMGGFLFICSFNLIIKAYQFVSIINLHFSFFYIDTFFPFLIHWYIFLLWQLTLNFLLLCFGFDFLFPECFLQVINL